jgi:2-oxo-4-hydroxy-4-carboxy--5-ureidoimidazoline (OHCU) decarboxylase
MKISKKEKFFLFEDIGNVQEFENELFSNSKYNSSSVVLDLGDSISDDDVKLFQNISEKYKEFGMSFVVRVSEYNAGGIDESLALAPTLQEAEDIITMEDLERELGF